MMRFIFVFFISLNTAYGYNRIISLSCETDQLLLEFCNKSQILALTKDSHDKTKSYHYDKALTYKTHSSRIDEIAKLKPDLILTTPEMVCMKQAMLHKLNIPIVKLKLCNSLKDVQQNLIHFGKATKTTQQCNAHWEKLQQGLTKQAQQTHQRALVYLPGKLTCGKGTLMDELIGHAGHINVTHALGKQSWGNITLEEIIKAKPTLILTSYHKANQPSLAQQTFNHPSLARLQAEHRHISERYMSAPTVFSLQILNEIKS